MRPTYLASNISSFARCIAASACALLSAALPATALSQAWPQKPVRILVAFAPGGTADVSARLTGDFVSKELGQPLIIENRTGGSGSVGIEAMLRGPADGYTLFVGSDSSFYQPVLNPKLAYRADKDLKPVTILTYQPIVIVVHPAPGWRTIGDLIKAAKAQPGRSSTRCRRRPALRLSPAACSSKSRA